MSVSGLVLGVIDAAIVVAILILLGALIEWFLGTLSVPVTPALRKGYLIVVALVGLYMLVALLFGIPSVHLLGGRVY